MADSKLNFFLSSGTAAERGAFTPDPPTPASGMAYTYLWVEEDTNKVYAWDAAGAAWLEMAMAGGAISAHETQHRSGGSDPLQLDNLAAPDDNTDLNASTSAHGLLLKATAPAAGLQNVVGIGNGETAYTNKALFDTTNPAALGTAAPGTSLIAARRDHVHALPVQTKTISWDLDGGGAAITTGAKQAYVRVPVACTIVKATIFGDDDIVIDVWAEEYASHPPTVLDTITAAAKPTLSGVTKNEDSTLTGWTVALAAGDVLEINVDSAAATKAQLILNVTVP